MPDIDHALNAQIGLPEGHRLGRADAFDLYRYLMGLLGKSSPMAPVSPVILMLYVDKHGDFTKMKTKRDSLVKQIFNNMDSSDQFTILGYIDLIENGDTEQDSL